jgi:hypothetical protein
MLAFQLVLSLQLQVAQAAVASASAAAGSTMPAVASAAVQMDCPMHKGEHDAVRDHNAAGGDDAAGAAHTAGTNKHAPAGDHNCCHASACQCHCTYTPAAAGLPAWCADARAVAVPSIASTQFVAPRIDEFLRPPIA